MVEERSYSIGQAAALSGLAASTLRYYESSAVAAAGAVVGRVSLPHDAQVDAEGTFYRNVGMRGGPAPARHYQPDLLKAVLDGSIDPGRVFDLTTDLDFVAEAYAAMDERRAVKAMLKVSAR